MKEIMRQAKGLQEELVRHRRYLHENAELGFDLPKTCAYVEQALRGMGYAVQKCGKSGLIATLGRGKCILLRADMDALPIVEQTKLPYACKDERMHACGHDLHTAMLLGGAKLLKANATKLKGSVKFLFQPAEEILQGAKKTIDDGVLLDTKPTRAFAMHVTAGTQLPTGTIVMQRGVGAPSADYFRITAQGKGCHGSSPWEGRDPLTVAARILLGAEELAARELSLQERAVVTAGSLQAGETGNVIPQTAVLRGTLRAYEESTREKIKQRLQEIAAYTAKAFGCKAKTEFEGGCPVLINDETLTEELYAFLQAGLGKERVLLMQNSYGGASEDFAYIAQEIPSVMIGISAGAKSDGYLYGLHNPKTRFDEEVLWQGSGIFAGVALAYAGK